MNTNILVFLAVTLGVVMLLKKLRISSIIAFLLAGIVMGPYGFGYYQTSGMWNLMSDLGIIFLWFMLGLELNIKRLWMLRKNIFGLGAAQVLVVASFLFPVVFLITSWTTMATIMVCLMLAMSSSGADLQTLADRNELQSTMGRQVFSILLFQDLLAIPLLAMIPVFMGKTFNLGAQAVDVSVMTIGLVLGVVIFAKLVMNPLMHLVSKIKSNEAFLLTVMLSIAGWAVLFNSIGLPMGIGAFLAGMLFSETIYHHEVRADIAPYQTLFVAMFFVVLGMGVNLQLLLEHIWIVVGGAVGMIVIKFAAIYMITRIRKVTSKNSFIIALLLSQGGEFGLLLLQTMRTWGINAIPASHAEIIMAIIIISMIVTPVLLLIFDALGQKGMFYSKKLAKKYNTNLRQASVIICGFGRVGMTIAEMLAQKNIPYAAIDMNVDRVLRGKTAGFNVYYGDTTRSDVLREFGVAPRKTKAVVVALDNAAVAKKSVRAVHRIGKGIKIFARARNLQESRTLIQEGAFLALPETVESSFLLGNGVLTNMGISEKEIDTVLLRMRENNYEHLDDVMQDS